VLTLPLPLLMQGLLILEVVTAEQGGLTEVVETEVAEMAVEVPQVPLGPVTENERVA
jgi:hypothetical protein